MVLILLPFITDSIDSIVRIKRGARARLRSTRSAPISHLISSLPPLRPVNNDEPDELNFLTERGKHVPL